MDENLSRGLGYSQLRNEAPKIDMNRLGEKVSPPRDRGNGVYIALILAGAGFLLPYNSFITAVDYYQAKFPASTIIFDMSMTYICMAFVSVLLNNMLVEALSLQTRITFGYILSFITMSTVALFDIWLEVFDNDVSYKITLVAVAIMALGCTGKQYNTTLIRPASHTGKQLRYYYLYYKCHVINSDNANVYAHKSYLFR